MHVRLEYEKYLEMMLVSGSYTRVKKFKDDLQKLKSIISIRFFIIDKKTKEREKIRIIDSKPQRKSSRYKAIWEGIFILYLF